MSYIQYTNKATHLDLRRDTLSAAQHCGRWPRRGGSPEVTLGEHTVDIAGEARGLLDEINRQRYKGEDVVVSLRPREPRVRWLAKLLAAERSGSELELEGERFNPQEDLAEGALGEAIGSLRRRAYRSARVHLADAGARTYSQARAQRVALWRALAALSSAVSYTDPAERLPPEPSRALAELLPKLDHLPDPERAHYATEAVRLQGLHARAAGDPAYALVWTLSRAALAAMTDEPDAALLWCLRAYSEAQEIGGVTPTEYLSSLVERARARLRLLTGDVPPDERAAAQKLVGSLRSTELLQGLIEHAERVTGLEPSPLINEYAPRQYLEGSV